MKKYLIFILAIISLIVLTSCKQTVNELITENGITIKVEGEFEKNYSLEVNKTDTNGLVNKVKLEKEIETEKVFYYEIKVKKGENDVLVSDNVIITLGLEDNTISSYGGYSYINDSLEELTITKNSNNIVFSSKGLGEYVIYSKGENNGNINDDKDLQLTKEEWIAIFSNAPENYEASMTTKSTLGAKGGHLVGIKQNSVKVDGLKREECEVDSTYSIIIKETYLKYNDQEKLDQMIAQNNKNYGQYELEGDTLKWLSVKPEEKIKYYEYFDSDDLYYVYSKKNEKTYKTLSFIEEYTDLFMIFKDQYDLAIWVDDHYELPNDTFKDIELAEGVQADRRDVIELYFTDKKLTKVVKDAFIRSEIEDTEISSYSEVFITYGNTTVTLPQYTNCAHEMYLYDDNNEKYHCKKCIECDSIVSYEEHNYNKVSGICENCKYKPTDTYELEIGCEHLGVKVTYNINTNIPTDIIVYGDYEHSYEGTTVTYACKDCDYKIISTAYYDTNYYKELVCSTSSYSVYEFLKNGEKDIDPMTAVWNIYFYHDCELTKTELINGEFFGHLKCKNCEKEGNGKLEYCYYVTDGDIYEISCRELEYYMNNIKLPHTYENGICIGCNKEENE